MSENLKVNANSSVLEHKRKHNLLVDNLPEIIDEKMQQGETMEGYSFQKYGETTNLTREYIYASVVKNGNKLTLVIALNLTRTGALDAGAVIGGFTIPTDVASKIFPSIIGNYDYVSVGSVSVWSNDATSKDLQIYSQKVDTDKIIFYGNYAPLENLTIDTKYYCRIELTLLLSDNLIPEPQGE